jgi:hypothetical protein
MFRCGPAPKILLFVAAPLRRGNRHLMKPKQKKQDAITLLVAGWMGSCINGSEGKQREKEIENDIRRSIDRSIDGPFIEVKYTRDDQYDGIQSNTADT